MAPTFHVATPHSPRGSIGQALNDFRNVSSLPADTPEELRFAHRMLSKVNRFTTNADAARPIIKALIASGHYNADDAEMLKLLSPETLKAMADRLEAKKKARRAARSPTERSGRLSTHGAAGRLPSTEVRVAMNARDRERAAAFAPMSTLEAHCRRTGQDFTAHSQRLAETERKRNAAARYVPRDPNQIGDGVPLSARERADVSASLPSSLDVWRKLQARDASSKSGTPKARKSNGMPYRDDEDADDAVEHAINMSRLQGKRT